MWCHEAGVGWGGAVAGASTWNRNAAGDVIGANIGGIDYVFHRALVIKAGDKIQGNKDVAIRILASGDLAYLALMLGRHDASAAWCIWCKWKQAQWQKSPGVGVNWTYEKMSKIYRDTYGDLDDLIALHNAAHAAGSAKQGIKRESLFDGSWLRFEDILHPPLHLQLGICTHLVQRLQIVIRRKFQKFTSDATSSSSTSSSTLKLRSSSPRRPRWTGPPRTSPL